MYRQLRALRSAASRIASSIHPAGYVSSASRSCSATIGVSMPTLASYSAKTLARSTTTGSGGVAVGSGASRAALRRFSGVLSRYRPAASSSVPREHASRSPRRTSSLDPSAVASTPSASSVAAGTALGEPFTCAAYQRKRSVHLSSAMSSISARSEPSRGAGTGSDRTPVSKPAPPGELPKVCIAGQPHAPVCATASVSKREKFSRK